MRGADFLALRTRRPDGAASRTRGRPDGPAPPAASRVQRDAPEQLSIRGERKRSEGSRSKGTLSHPKIPTVPATRVPSRYRSLRDDIFRPTNATSDPDESEETR